MCLVVRFFVLPPFTLTCSALHCEGGIGGVPVVRPCLCVSFVFHFFLSSSSTGNDSHSLSPLPPLHLTSRSLLPFFTSGRDASSSSSSVTPTDTTPHAKKTHALPPFYPSLAHNSAHSTASSGLTRGQEGKSPAKTKNTNKQHGRKRASNEKGQGNTEPR